MAMQMPHKLTDIETEMLEALKLLGGYSLSDMQALAEEAFRDLMEERVRPTSLNKELSPIQREHVRRGAR
jgi:hypothetical protein